MSGIRNLDQIRNTDPRLYEALSDIIGRQNNIEQQMNANGVGNPQPPPTVNGVQVTGSNGFLHVAITDQGGLYRGIRYFTEHADNPAFTNPQVVPMGDSRNVTIPVGNQTRYVRVYSSYISSHPSDPVYHGSSVAPTPVNGGGSNSGPQFLPSQGSGTGDAGVGLQGPGRVAFRSDNGVPPVRSNKSGA